MFIASLRAKIYIKFWLIFNCTFSLLLALEEDFKKFRSFIETKKASLFVAADKGDLVFCKLLLCDGLIIDSADTRKQTPLYAAASRGHRC